MKLGILVAEDVDSLAAFIRSEATTLELSASSTTPCPAGKSAFPGKSVNSLYNPEILLAQNMTLSLTNGNVN